MLFKNPFKKRDGIIHRTFVNEREIAALLSDIYFNGAQVVGCGQLFGQAVFPYFWIEEAAGEKLDDLISFINEDDTELYVSVSTNTIGDNFPNNPCRYMIRFNFTVYNQSGEIRRLIIYFNAEKYGQFVQTVLTTGKICVLFREPVVEPGSTLLSTLMDDSGYLTFNFVDAAGIKYPHVQRLLAQIEKEQKQVHRK